MNKSLRYLGILSLASFSMLITSCVKQEFDEPETANVDPNIPVTKTISEIKTGIGTTPTLISTNEVIAGVIIADDASGNFYKKMVIQDSTGGIAIVLDMTDFNAMYPVGRRVFIKCQGLYIADDGDGNYEIGTRNGTAIGRIPFDLVGLYIIPGKWGIPVTPKVVTLNTITSEPTLTLVKIVDAEFQPSDTAQLFSDASTGTYNRYIRSCSTGSTLIDIYTSSFANFATSLTPTGNGSIVAVYSMYAGAAELQVRDLNDIKFTNPRCNAGGGGNVHPIDSLRMMYAGSDITVPAGWTLHGVVISNNATGNITAKNMVIQDGTAGIVIRFTANNTFFAQNDSVSVNISGYTLTEFNGLLEVNNVDPASAASLGTGSVTPQVVTAAAVTAGVNTYESKLIQVTGAMISGTGTYSGSQTITDASGTVVMYTSSAATFASQSYPTGTVTITGYISDFGGTAEIILRDPNVDVQ